MARHQARSASLLTAFEPMGMPTDESLNQAAMDELARALKESGNVVLATEAAAGLTRNGAPRRAP